MKAAVGLNDVTVTFTDVRDRRPGLVSVEMSVPPDGEPGDLAAGPCCSGGTWKARSDRRISVIFGRPNCCCPDAPF